MIMYFIGGMAIGCILGFLFGKLHERWEWNRLIWTGNLPTPVEARWSHLKRRG